MIYSFLREVGGWDVSDLMWEYPNFVNNPVEVFHLVGLDTFGKVGFFSWFELREFLQDKLGWKFLRAERFVAHVKRNFEYWERPDGFSIFEDDPKHEYGNFHYSTASDAMTEQF